MGKGQIARNEQFFLFSQCFLLNQIIVTPFVHIFDIIYTTESDEPKIGISGKGLYGLEDAGFNDMVVLFSFNLTGTLDTPG